MGWVKKIDFRPSEKVVFGGILKNMSLLHNTDRNLILFRVDFYVRQRIIFQPDF